MLITDDLNMGAVYDLGIGRVAAEALAAGVDLILVSYDPRQVYRAIYGAAQAFEQGGIGRSRLLNSQQRIEKFILPGGTGAAFGTNAKIAHPVSKPPRDAPVDS